MRQKSYRSYGRGGEVNPAGGLLAAFCIGLVFAAPWLIAIIAVLQAVEWLFR